LLSLDTLEKRKLTSPPEQHWYGDWHPVFSTDGQTLAFLRDSSIATEDVYVVSISGGEPRRMTFDNTGIGGLAWTNDGSHIVFTSNRGGDADLRFWILSVSGGTPEPMATGGERGSDLTISRKGNRLAYTLDSAGNTDIWRIELSSSTGRGSPPTKFIASTREEADPQYSPDGKRIVFVSNRSGSDEIWICDADGSNLVQLTHFGGPRGGSAHWSPDGRQIAFDSRPEGRSHIYLISSEGGRPERITAGDSDETVPTWSMDGKWIYFSSNRNGGRHMM
jgi:Tol biopolymer transport system component